MVNVLQWYDNVSVLLILSNKHAVLHACTCTVDCLVCSISVGAVNLHKYSTMTTFSELLKHLQYEPI